MALFHKPYTGFSEAGCFVVSEGFYLVFFYTNLKCEKLLRNSEHDIHSQRLYAFPGAQVSHRNVGQDTREKI